MTLSGSRNSGHMESIDTIRDEDVEVTLLKSIPLGFARTNQIFPLRVHDSELIGAVADYKIALISGFHKHANLDMVWYGDDWGTQDRLFLPPKAD